MRSFSVRAFGHIQEFEREVVHARSDFSNHLTEMVVEDRRRYGCEQTDGGGDERFGNARTDGTKTRGALLVELLERANDAQHRPEQADERADGRGGRKPA